MMTMMLIDNNDNNDNNEIITKGMNSKYNIYIYIYLYIYIYIYIYIHIRKRIIHKKIYSTSKFLSLVLRYVVSHDLQDFGLLSTLYFIYARLSIL